MSNQKTLKDTNNAISLQESEDGQLRLDLQDGLMTDQYGQEAARANLSVLPDDKAVRHLPLLPQAAPQPGGI